jgi:enolase
VGCGTDICSAQNPNSDPTKWLTGEQLGQHYHDLIAKYPIVSIEDPFDQDDWEAWSKFTTSGQTQVVGDGTSESIGVSGFETHACIA